MPDLLHKLSYFKTLFKFRNVLSGPHAQQAKHTSRGWGEYTGLCEWVGVGLHASFVVVFQKWCKKIDIGVKPRYCDWGSRTGHHQPVINDLQLLCLNFYSRNQRSDQHKITIQKKIIKRSAIQAHDLIFIRVGLIYLYLIIIIIIFFVFSLTTY